MRALWIAIVIAGCSLDFDTLRGNDDADDMNAPHDGSATDDMSVSPTTEAGVNQGGGGQNGSGGNAGENGSGGNGGHGGHGNGGNTGNAGENGSDPNNIRTAKLNGCDIAGTVTEFEKDFVHPRCGKNSSCHDGNIFPPRLRKSDENLFTKLANLQPSAVISLCKNTGTYYININDPAKSFILTKVTQKEPKCPGNESQEAGEQCPWNEVPLANNELKCMEAYVKAIAEACKKPGPGCGNTMGSGATGGGGMTGAGGSGGTHSGGGAGGNTQSGGSGGNTQSGGTAGSMNTGGSPPVITLTTGLIGHWKFDEGSGTTVTDSSGQGNHGVVVNGGVPDAPSHNNPNWTCNGKVGGALQFNGSSDWVRIPSSSSINTIGMTENVTVAAWVKIVGSNPTDKPYNHVLQRDVSGTRLEHFALGTYQGLPVGSIYPVGLIYSESLMGVTQVPSDGTWVHLAQTYDGYTQYLYMNGAQVRPGQDVGISPKVDTTPVTIGGAINENEVIEHFPGVIDEVRLYNRRLSDAEINALYTNGKNASGGTNCTGTGGMTGSTGGTGGGGMPGSGTGGMMGSTGGAGGTGDMVIGLPVSGVAAGADHTCAWLMDGTVRCWGNNSYGQLGDGTTIQRHTPTTVPGLTGVVELSLGLYYSCARLTNGTVRCWGRNSSGKLGDGTDIDRHTPTTVLDLSNVAGISTGLYHTCAWLTNGTPRCWGRNSTRALGDGTSTERRTPITVPGLTGVAEMVTGGGHTCARLFDGTVRCWGSNGDGQLGDGTIVSPRPAPVVVPGLSNVAELTVGSGYTCARLADGTVRCWGNNSDGRLGDGTTMIRLTPTPVLDLSNAIEIAAGHNNHTCARRIDNTLRCWGQNNSGKLGDGTTTQRFTPIAVLNISNAAGVAVGSSHTCAWLTNGMVRCWGNNSYGQLGDGTTTSRHTPTPVPVD